MALGEKASYTKERLRERWSTLSDPDHSGTEQRFLTFGLSQSDRLLVVAHTDGAEKHESLVRV